MSLPLAASVAHDKPR